MADPTGTLILDAVRYPHLTDDSKHALVVWFKSMGETLGHCREMWLDDDGAQVTLVLTSVIVDNVPSERWVRVSAAGMPALRLKDSAAKYFGDAA